VIIAIYTVVDALGARASGNPLQYVVALFVLDGWPFAAAGAHARGADAPGRTRAGAAPVALAARRLAGLLRHRACGP
jgi:hypothetical protein